MAEQILGILADLLKISIPAGLVVYGMYLTIRAYATRDLEKTLVEHRNKADQENLKLRLQAYERWVLFLERTAPQNLFMRESNPELNVAYWRQQLVSTVNQEFMHNVSAQLYISDLAFEQIKQSMQQVLTIINTAADSLDGNEPSFNLITKSFELIIESGAGDPTATALATLRNEVRVVMG